MVRWTRDFAWALVSGFIVLVFSLAVTKDVLKAAVIALVATTVVALTLTVLHWWLAKIRATPPLRAAPGRVGIHIGEGATRTSVDANKISGMDTGIEDHGEDTDIGHNEIR